MTIHLLPHYAISEFSSFWLLRHLPLPDCSDAIRKHQVVDPFVISSCRVDVCHDVDWQTFFLAEYLIEKTILTVFRYQIDDCSIAAPYHDRRILQGHFTAETKQRRLALSLEFVDLRGHSTQSGTRRAQSESLRGSQALINPVVGERGIVLQNSGPLRHTTKYIALSNARIYHTNPSSQRSTSLPHTSYFPRPYRFTSAARRSSIIAAGPQVCIASLPPAIEVCSRLSSSI